MKRLLTIVVLVGSTAFAATSAMANNVNVDVAIGAPGPVYASASVASHGTQPIGYPHATHYQERYYQPAPTHAPVVMGTYRHGHDGYREGYSMSPYRPVARHGYHN